MNDIAKTGMHFCYTLQTRPDGRSIIDSFREVEYPEMLDPLTMEPGMTSLSSSWADVGDSIDVSYPVLSRSEVQMEDMEVSKYSTGQISEESLGVKTDVMKHF